MIVFFNYYNTLLKGHLIFYSVSLGKTYTQQQVVTVFSDQQYAPKGVGERERYIPPFYMRAPFSFAPHNSNLLKFVRPNMKSSVTTILVQVLNIVFQCKSHVQPTAVLFKTIISCDCVSVNCLRIHLNIVVRF